MRRLDATSVVLLLCVTLALAFVDHRVRSDRYREHVVSEYIPSVLGGTSGAPAKYRVAMPYAIELFTRQTGGDPYLVFLGVEIFFIGASLLMVYVYLRRWYAEGASLAGTLGVAAFLPLTFTNSWAHPDTFPDLFLFTAGCLAVAARRDALLALILLVGMFNRETMGFLALLWAAERWPEWRSKGTIMRGVMLFGLCGGVYVGLRWARGFEHYQMWMVQKNLEYMNVLPEGFDPFTRVAGFFWIVLLGAPAWLAWSAAQQPDSPRFFMSGWSIAILFIVVAWLFAAIIETRVFVPALPLLLPGAIASFVTPMRYRATDR